MYRFCFHWTKVAQQRSNKATLDNQTRLGGDRTKATTKQQQAASTTKKISGAIAAARGQQQKQAKRRSASEISGMEKAGISSGAVVMGETAAVALDSLQQTNGGLLSRTSQASTTTTTSGKTKAKKTKGRVKIKMEFIENKIRRYTTFSKRKTGIMKKVKYNVNLIINLAIKTDSMNLLY